MQARNALYSPYGGYELKAKYQRNFGLGTLITAGFVILILLVTWVITKLGEEDLEAIDLSASELWWYPACRVTRAMR